MFQNKAAMVTAGWTVKFSCDGATGPANGADATDRWATQANCTVRAVNNATAQSWIVLQNADGVQVRFTYLGATDDIFDVAFSPSGLYTLQATTTFPPSATDNVTIATGTSIVNATASNDRIMSIWTSSDTKGWRFALFRQSAIINIIGVERVNNLCGSFIFGTGAADIPYVGFRHASATRNQNAGSGPVGGASGTAIGAAGFAGTAARIFTGGASRLARCGGGDIGVCSAPNIANVISSIFIADKPATLGGLTSPCLPIFWSGEKSANLDGFIGYPIDWWQMVTSSLAIPALADMVPGFEPADVPGVSGGQTGVGDPRTNWCVALGSAIIWPWRNAAATMEII